MALFATGIEAPEGPVALADGSLYVTEMSAATSCISKLDPAGRRTPVRKTGGRPAGLALDGEGLVWAADADLRCVLCVSPEGREVLRIHGPDDDPFRFPNDLAFGPDGHLYLTDSGMVGSDFVRGQDLVDGFEDLPWDGRIYEIDPRRGKVVRSIDRGIRFSNGIAFDADDRLYVNATLPGEVYRYEVFGTSASRREVFGSVLQPDDRPGLRGPDGMKFGTDGRLYCAVFNQGNVTVLDRDGRLAERLQLEGGCPTNCAFSLSGTTLLVTEAGKGQVEAIPVPCPGLPLHRPLLRLA